MIGSTNAGGGGGLNIRVVGGTTQPGAPREGTIWVKTEAAKPDYLLAESQPENPAEGLVWIKLGGDGVSLPVDKKGTLAITLASCAIYSGGSWANSDAWVYTDGQWVQFSRQVLTIYADGQLADGFAVPSHMILNTNNATLNLTIQHSSDCITSSYDGLGGLVFTPSVDISSYKILEMDVSWAVAGVSSIAIGVSADAKVYERSLANDMDAKFYTETSLSRNVVSVDISAVTGIKYIKIEAYNQFASAIKVYRAELK